MAKTKLIITTNYSNCLEIETIISWFEKKGFVNLQFEKDSFGIQSNRWIYHKVSKNTGFSTFVIEDIWGSLIAFEIKVSGNKIECYGYCPILVFGVFSFNLSLKKKTTWITRYRQHGFTYFEEFKTFVSKA